MTRSAGSICSSLAVLTLLAAGPGNAATWTPITRPILQSTSAAIYDPVRDRLVEFGGVSGFPVSLTRALSLSGPPSWTDLAAAGTPPPARQGHVAIYDPARDRVVVFGGFGGAAPPEFSDTWALQFSPTPQWTQLPSGSSIGGLIGSAAVYDAPRDRMLLFGGSGGGSLHNEVWSYDFAAGAGWALVTTAGTPPSLRAGHAMVFDAARDRVLVLGGATGGGPGSVDVFALSLSGTPTWTEVAAAGTPPSARVGVRGVYDPGNDRVLLFGGYANGDGGYKNEVWSLSLAGAPAWSRLSIAPPLPQPRFYHQAVWDQARARMLVVSGTLPYNGGVWALSTGATPAWSLAQPDTTIAAGTTNLNVDESQQRVLVSTQASVFTLPLDGSQDLIDLHPVQPAPFSMFVFLDAARHRIDGIANDAGGLSRAFDYDAPGQPWSTTGSGFANSSNSWTGVFDVAGDRLVFYGKDGVLQGAPGSNLVWSPLSASGVAPAPRSRASVAYDAATRRMWVVGGSVSCNCDNGDRIYALDLSGSPTWISMPVAAGPRPAGPRLDAAVAWDTHSSRLLMYGGTAFTDTWQLTTVGDSLRWEQILTDNQPAPGPGAAGGAYDAIHDRFLVFGDGMERIYALTPPVIAGVGPPPPAPALAFSVVNPARHGGLALHLTLSEDAEVSIALVDVTGRTMLSRVEHRPSGTQEIVLQTTGAIRPGVYFVHVQAGGQTATRRVAVIE